jgi:hypothetical protein
LLARGLSPQSITFLSGEAGSAQVANLPTTDGLGAAALLGLGGAAAGASVGDASEHAMDKGVPKDDVFFYRQLLKRGRSLVIAEVEFDDQAAAAREVFYRRGGEDVDEARKQLQSVA